MTMTIDPVVKTATVPQDPAAAFALFTTEFNRWWPRATHSVGLERAERVDFGDGVGGEIIETVADGTTTSWGTILAWDPPHRLCFSWHPGTDPATPTTVEVTFEAIGADGGTLVVLTHSDWHQHPLGARMREGYDVGWDTVFGCYVASAG